MPKHQNNTQVTFYADKWIKMWTKFSKYVSDNRLRNAQIFGG